MKMVNYTINPNHMFSGQLAFLSNMYPCRVTVEINGTEYTFPNAEAAFQAGKCQNPEDVPLFMNIRDGAAAKRLGRKVKMCTEWNKERIQWMETVVEAKFTQNSELMEKLQDTYPLKLVETNTWKDRFWGVYQGEGENHLGKILMGVRELYREKPDMKGELDVLSTR